jgi:hypothetical protein
LPLRFPKDASARFPSFKTEAYPAVGFVALHIVYGMRHYALDKPTKGRDFPFFPASYFGMNNVQTGAVLTAECL